MASTPTEIAESLAECYPPVDEYGQCALCDAPPRANMLLQYGNHLAGCPWRMAMEWYKATLDGTD